MRGTTRPCIIANRKFDRLRLASSCCVQFRYQALRGGSARTELTSFAYFPQSTQVYRAGVRTLNAT
jgi:hypothetical protein